VSKLVRRLGRCSIISAREDKKNKQLFKTLIQLRMLIVITVKTINWLILSASQRPFGNILRASHPKGFFG
jgi:hypothetical protein